jgi:hypothetical protein
MTRLALVMRCVLLAAVCIAHPLFAQSAIFTGRVLTDPDERPIAGARLEIRALGRSVVTDSTGTFRLTGIPVGTHDVHVRAVGYDSVVTRLDFTGAGIDGADFLMRAIATKLDRVDVTATRKTVMDYRLSEFNERRATGLGRFLDSTVFARERERDIDAVLIANIPGLRLRRVGSKQVLASTRGGRVCFPQIVVDGMSVYSGDDKNAPRGISGEPLQIFDIRTITTRDVIAFEYHNPATTPLRFNATAMGADGSFCGTAIFWTR